MAIEMEPVFFFRCAKAIAANMNDDIHVWNQLA
jgi:hypothetical protein